MFIKCRHKNDIKTDIKHKNSYVVCVFLCQKIDQNSEDATEAMLPDFMKVAELEVKTEDFRPSPEFDFWASLKRTLRID